MKVEFEDAKGNYGFVEDESGKYNWSYEGDFKDVYAALVIPENRQGHSKPENTPIDLNDDYITDFTSKEKVRKAFQNLHEEPLIHAIVKDGEKII